MKTKHLFFALLLTIVGTMQLQASTVYYFKATNHKFAVLSWAEGAKKQWSDWMTPVNGHTGWYQTTIPDDHNKVIFASFDIYTKTPEWDNQVYKTEDLSYDSTHAYYCRGWSRDFDLGVITASGKWGSNIEWALYGTSGMSLGSLLYISGTGAMQNSTIFENYPWKDASLRNNIIEVVIEDGVTRIGDYAFAYMDRMEYIILPNSVTSIGEGALYACKNLYSITIPNSVTSIESEAICGGNKYKKVNFLSTNPCALGDNALYGTYTINVPYCYLDTYKQAWKDYADRINGNGEPNVVIKTKKAEYGYVKVPNLTCSDDVQIEAVPDKGYHFVRWNDGNTDNPRIVPNEETTYTAEFAINEYTVTFVDWDGKVLKSEQVKHGKSATAPANPQRDGYRFICWDKDFRIVLSDMTITAQYSKINANPITVRLDAESAKDWSEVRLYFWGDEVYVTWPGIALSEDNDGWYSCTFDNSVNKVNIIWTDGTNQTVDITDVSNSTCYQLNSTYGKAITVSVVECPNKYTVTFVDWDGKVLKSEEVEHGKSATAPAAPQRDGYRFIGWDKDFSNVQSDLKITAQYTISTYIVVFQDWDERVISTQEVEHGKSATAPADPQRDGYRFIGWDKDFTNIQSDLTTTALYEQIEDGLDYHIDTQHLTQPTKVLIDGAVYILMPDGRMLNLQGAEVK